MSKVCLPIVVPIALLAWIALAGHVPRAAAAEPPTAVVIFDGSGSMWGKLDGERSSKLVMAREAVRQGLARLTPATRVGLMSFGHRRGGDCSDTEVLVEPAPLDIERVMTPIERLNPRGRGPITRALREAAARLGPQSAPATVVVIHDGADNCQQDPCAAVGELRAAHPNVRIDVVSLGLPAEEAATVACLPKATGGKHYQVQTTVDLDAAIVDALTRAADAQPRPAVSKPAPPPVAAPAPAPPVAGAAEPGGGRPGLQLWTSLVKGGPALALPARWTVRKAGDKAPIWEGETPAPLLIVPTGRYDIEVRVGLVTKAAVAEAAEGQPRALGLVLDAGTLAFAPTPAAKAMLDDGIVTLARIEAKGPAEPQILRNIEAEMALAPGNYLVAVTSGALRIERPVGIVAGERISIANALALGGLELSAAAAKDGPALSGLVYALYEDDPDAPQGRREVARSAAPAPRFKLPAGNYYVVARRGGAEVRDRITVKAGEIERRLLILETGQVAISIQIAGNRVESDGPIVHRLERIDVQPTEVTSTSGPSATLDVAAGHYRLESRIGLGNVRLARELRLKPGESERVTADLAAGSARFRLLEPAGGRPLPDVSFEVRDRSGQLVWAGLGTEPRALLLAGRYTLRAEGRGLAAERSFDVSAGEDRTVELATK